MSESPLSREDVAYIKEMGLRKEQGLKSVSQAQLARELGVSEKTISRIIHNKTHKDVAPRVQILDQHRELAAYFALHPEEAALPHVPEEEVCTGNALIEFKNKYRFDTKRPLFWGWYEDFNGIHGVVSDGVLILLDNTPYPFIRFAKHAKEMKLDEAPWFSSKACELPTFALRDLMTEPPGLQLFFACDLPEDCVLVVTEDKAGEYIIKRKFLELADKRGYHLREAGENPGYIYMTQRVKNSPSDPTDPDVIQGTFCDPVGAICVMVTE